MKRPFQTPEAAVPLALSLVLLASVGFAAVLSSGSAARAESAWSLAALLVGGVALAMFRPRVGLALGAATLAPVTLWFGPAVAGGVAALLRVAQLLLRPPAEPGGAPAGRPPPVRVLFTSGMALGVAGALAATLWFVLIGVAAETPSRAAVVGWAVAAGIAQAALVAGLGWVVRWAEGPSEDARRPLDPGLLLDVAGWTLGGVLAVVFLGAGFAVGLAVLAVVAALALELARNERLVARRNRQLAALSEMSAAGRRLSGPSLELESVAESIIRESRRIVGAQWVRLEVEADDSERVSWRCGPDGEVSEGAPEPPASPPVIPGLHRRAAWQVLDKELVANERTIATLELWTNPRRTDWEQHELLDALLPQLATSLAAVVADRRAGRDALTHVATRGVLGDQLERAYERANRDGTAMAVVMCDVDHFKSINDRFGHEIGDRALREVAETLERHSRGHDVVCRYGGEEFAVLMDGADGRAAVAAAERLRRAIEEIELEANGEPFGLAASFGVASFPAIYVDSGAELIPLADAALYEAKRRGRNRSVLALGQGRFENHRGREIQGNARAEEIAAPRLFV